MTAVVHLNTWDCKGGAARAVSRLHSGLLALGYDSRMLVGFAQGEEGARLRTVSHGRSVWKRGLYRATLGFEKLSGLQYLTLEGWSEEVVRHPFVQHADVVHLHNVHGGYVSHTILPKLSHRVPVIWTLHDMWPLTGHCSFPLECERWRTGCGHCPLLSDYPALAFDTTALLWRVKRWLYGRSELTIVVLCRWMADRVRESPLLGRFEVRLIPYGIDTNTFKAIPKTVAREQLGIPADAKVIMFAAVHLQERRKGFTYLSHALHRLRDSGYRNLWVVTAGAGAPDSGKEPLPYPVRHLGNVTSDELMVAGYSAADLFVGPSLGELFGQVFAEAMACGTPCVAFNVMAAPEVIRHMETGYLAAYRDTEDLVNGLRLLLTNDRLRSSMSQRCRGAIEREFPLELEGKRMAALYQEALAQYRNRRQRIPPARREDGAALQFAAATRISHGS